MVIAMVANRETIIEGWPLLTVETEVNEDSKNTNERGPSLVSSLDLSSRWRTRAPCICSQSFCCHFQINFLKRPFRVFTDFLGR